MASKYTHDIVATTGEYTNNQGEKKKEYTNCGKAFTDDQGRVSLLMKTMPVGPSWSGWLSLYPAKDRDGQQAPSPRQSQQSSTPSHASSSDDDGDDIPF